MFPVIAPAAEADAIVVVSKAKTHVLTAMTGGTKCLFGVLPGMEKPSFHGRLSGVDEFCGMLLDLNEAMMPKLQVMDAVVGMEGDGPSGGTPRPLGAVLASGNPLALDIVAARLMGFRPGDVPVIRMGADRGMVTADMNVSVLGESVEAMTAQDFRHPSSTAASRLGAGAPILGRLLRAYALRPVVDRGRCNGCGRCARSCPRETIRMVRGKARIRHGRCVRCYCCHEMCENRAIELKRSTGGKAIALLMGGREGRS
jgi:ferredoxin